MDRDDRAAAAPTDATRVAVALTDAAAELSLPVPRPARRVGPVGAALGRAVPGVGRVVDQIDRYADWWDAHNVAAVSDLDPSGTAAADGEPPALWIALGDSTAQGIGASAPDQGWVGDLARRFTSIGHELRLVNLSVSGARTADLIEVQLPRFEALVERFGPPALVTVAIGANDVFRSPNVARLRRNIDHIAAALPAGSVLSLVPQAPGSLLGKLANDGVRGAAERHDHRIAHVNRFYRAPYRGKVASDRFHPNDLGYVDWADSFAAALSGAFDIERAAA